MGPRKPRRSKPTHESNRQSRERYKRNPISALYRSPKWRKCREQFLRRYPRCIRCNQPAKLIDHIEPHKGDEAKFWDTSNWAPMCNRCHSAKTAALDGGFGNRVGGSSSPLGQCDENGNPTDPNHPWNLNK